MTIQKQLKDGRIQKGLSQEEAADQVGISRRTLAYYENGERTPNADILLKLCELYSIRVDTLITESMETPKAQDDGLKETIEQYLAFQETRKNAFKKGAFVALASVSILILVVLALLCVLRFRLMAIYGYNFGEATAALWTGLFSTLIDFVNNEVVQTVPVLSILIASSILFSWAVYFLIKFLLKRKK